MTFETSAFNIFNKLEAGQRVYDLDKDFIELAKEVTEERVNSMYVFDTMNKFFEDNYIDLHINSYLNIVKLTSYLEYTLITNKHKPSTLKKKIKNGQIKGL